MDTKSILQIFYDLGIPIAKIAKRIGKDPSTIQKWLRGTSGYLKKETEDELRQTLLEIQEEIIKIKF